MPLRLLLGPQRPIMNLGAAVANASLPEGPIAVISAGWQEAEGDISDVNELVPGQLVDLRLYHRAEQVFAADRALHAAYRERQDRLQELQRLYRMRLRQLMIAARQLRRARATPDLVAAEHRHALSQLRALDRHHNNRIASVYGEFEARLARGASAALDEQMNNIQQDIDACGTVVITGGNVLVLLNRLQLFGMRDLLMPRHLVAWSAGAMVLGDLVVLYHDRIPMGRRDPEVLGQGIGILHGKIFLPDARKRLLQSDAIRMELFFERFSPNQCITLDSGNLLTFEDDTITAAEGAACLTSQGATRAVVNA